MRGDGGQVRPGPGHDVDELVAAAAEGHPAAAADLVGQAVQRVVRRPLGVDGQGQVRQRVLEVGVAAVLGDQDVGREGPEQRPAPAAWNARSQPASPVPGGSATFTAVPSASGPPVSAGNPVPGNSTRPLSCSEIVSTRGSSQNIRSTPSPWCTSTSTYATRWAPWSSSHWMPTAVSL